MKQKIKTLVTAMAGLFAVGIADGMFDWGLSDDAYIFLGCADLFCITWLLLIVYGKKFKEMEEV